MTGNLVWLAIASLVFGRFAWAVRFHFESARMPPLMMLVSTLALAAFLVGAINFWSNPPNTLRASLALVMIMAAYWLFQSALRASAGNALSLAFDPTAPAQMLDGGPYRFVRHPFYVAYLIYWFGFALAAPSLPMFTLVLVLVSLYVLSALGEERALLASIHGQAYRDYQRSVGFFWPKPRQSGGRQ